MRVLIIGGTRFIGPEVARRLHAQGHEVTLFHRGRTKADLPLEVKHVFGNRNDVVSFQQKVEKIRTDVILDMIPTTKQHAQILVDVFGGIAERLVAISSQDVYRAYGIFIGKEPGEEVVPIIEDSPLRNRLYPYRLDRPRSDNDPQRFLDDYDKILVEKVVMNNNRLPGTILRLPHMYGPGDYHHRLFEYLKRIDDGRPVIILEEGLASWRCTRGYVENVADAIVLALTKEIATNRIYNVGEPMDLTTAGWVRKIGQIADWSGEILIAPRNRLHPSMMCNMNTRQHVVVDTTRIREELGYHEAISQDEALKRTINWERQNPPERIRPEQFDYDAEDKLYKTLRN